MEHIFLEFFNPNDSSHIEWYIHHRQYGRWPQEMFDVLKLVGCEAPQLMDPISVAIKIADNSVGYVYVC